MQSNNQDFEIFSNQYQTQEKEILVLTNDESVTASKLNNTWEPSLYFLAYHDLETQEIKNGNGRINWLISENDYKKFGINHPYDFKKGTIYHLRVRELKDKKIPEGRIASFYNSFMLIEIISENVKNDELNSILEEYRAPVEIRDENLGKFILDKNYDTFSGKINWLDKEIAVTIEVDIDDKETWKKGINIIQKLSDSQQKHDEEFRNFAAEQLTDLANDWSEEENKEISQQDFVRRINLLELVIINEEDYTVYYDDGDLFYGHIIEISGNIKTGLESANIAG